MDIDFKPSGDAASSSSPFPPIVCSDGIPGAYAFDSTVFSDSTFPTLVPLPFSAFYTSTLSHELGDASFFNSDSQLARSNFPKTQLSSYFNSHDSTEYHQLGDSNSFLNSTYVSENLKIPKPEPLSYFNSEELTTLDFFSKNLPSLQSLESPSLRRPFDSLFINLNSAPPSSSLSTAVTPQKQPEKPRRKRVSDKFHLLQKLLPLGKKMDTATMLAEAYKYVKFLQAQVKALQTMPTDSSFYGDVGVGGLGNLFGKMEILSRQQMLQVLLNTPEAQTRLYSQGCCVYSIEQLVIMKKVAEGRALFNQQVILDARRNS